MTTTALSVDRDVADLAVEYLALFGDDAALAARARAERSRDLGNLVHFCRWNDVSRLVGAMLDGEGATRH
jgi:hypothetical protein